MKEGCDMLRVLLHYKIKRVLFSDPLPTMSKVNNALLASPNKQISPTSFDIFSSCFYNKYTGLRGIFMLEWEGHHPVEAVKPRSSL